MKRPFPAYKGDDPFVFISYSHRDSAAVFKEIAWLKSQGFNIWYDEGIEAGREWRDEIATAISKASVLLYFVTPESVASENCRNEVNFASDELTPILTVYLKPTELPGGLRLTISTRQAINRYDLSMDEYSHKLNVSLAEYVGMAPLPIQTGSPASSRFRYWLILAAIILIGGGALTYIVPGIVPDIVPDMVDGVVNGFDDDRSQSPVLPESRLRSIAVLPFQNLNQDPVFDQISDGIALDLVNGLSKIHAIRVAAATSSFAFKNQYSDVSAIGKKLKVDTVLEGSVRIIDDIARINVQLLLVEDGYQLWSESYDRPFTDVLALQDDVAALILNSVRLHLIDKSAVNEGSVALGSYNLYLIARDNMRERTEQSLLLAKSQFTEALALDPEYGPAWADLARTVLLLSDLQYGDVPFIEAKEEAKQMLARAFELEPELSSAYATEGFLYLNEANQMEALSSFHRAIATDPNNAYAHFMISEILASSGNFAGALKELEVAYALDSRHPVIQYRLVIYYLGQGNFSGVRQSVRPDQALLADALIDFRLGREADGIVKATEYLNLEESGFAGIHLRMELARRYYYKLKNIDMAQKTISETNAFAGRVYFQALEYPEVAYQLLKKIPDGYHNRFSKFLLARSEIRTGRFDDCLDAVGYQSVETMPIRGEIYLGLPGNELSLAFFAAYCLSELGRVEEAARLQEELMRYHRLAIQQGEPPGYFRLLARLELLGGNHDEAVRLLQEAYANQALDWTDLGNPWYDILRSRPDFVALVEAVYGHMNQQRQQLGWPPVQPIE